MLIPSTLASLLIVISFHWDVSKLTLLRATLHEVMQYRMHTNEVDIVVVTDDREALSNAFSVFKYDSIDIHMFNRSTSKHNTGDKYDLLWEHRDIVEQRFRNVEGGYPNYTTFLYMEDDTLIPWSHLVSWAIDNEILEKLGFSRGIFRTEINKAGKLSMNDMVVDLANSLGCQMNITNDPSNRHYVRTIDLMDYSVESKALYQENLERYGRHKCLNHDETATWNRRMLSLSSKASNFPTDRGHHTHYALQNHSPVQPHQRVTCPVHHRFVQLYSPFQGMWIFSRSQLVTIMTDPLWNRKQSMKKDVRRVGQKNWNWGSPERSNSILYFVNPPTGFLTTNLIPFDFLNSDMTKPRLSSYASVEHLRNGYDIICTVDEALTV